MYSPGSLQINLIFFFFNDTATTEIYTLSLHDALPISSNWRTSLHSPSLRVPGWPTVGRSEEHTSELQSRPHLVCRLLLEKKNEQLRSEILQQIIKHTVAADLIDHDTKYHINPTRRFLT